jgi:hypothetical protein
MGIVDIGLLGTLYSLRGCAIHLYSGIYPQDSVDMITVENKINEVLFGTRLF